MLDGCEGCSYHSFPYNAPVPIIGVGNIKFNCVEDVWEIIDMLVEETKETNDKTNREFDIALSIKAQIPFFACPNHVLDVGVQKDIKRFMYCKENSVKPYPGDYGDQPYMWVEKYFIIKKAFAKLEKNLIEQNSKKGK